MNIIYNKNTGAIDRAISEDVDYKVLLSSFPKEFVDELDSLYYDGVPPRPLRNYYVDVEILELIKYSNDVIEEKQKYGKILTEEERLNILLQPSRKEVQKAESTLEILLTLQEVGLIWQQKTNFI